MKRVLRALGVIILLAAMAYASNWDLPKQSHQDWEEEHWEELQRYEEERGKTYRIVIGDDVYEGAYLGEIEVE